MTDATASTPAPSAPAALTPPAGLSSAQVAERRSRGLTNAGGERTSRSVAEILRANIVTRFNLILGVLLAVILAVGQPQDALFGIVLVANAVIGIAQELRAKRTLDRLAVLSAPRVQVIRDGAPHDIAVDELVADDLVDLRAGDQLVADGVVRDSTSLQADESLLTGESEPVDKRAGDQLLSGSFVVAPAEEALGALADDEARNATLAASGQRVLALAHTTGSLDGQALPPGLRGGLHRARGAAEIRRSADHRLLRRLGRGAQGDLRGQPAHGERRRGARGHPPRRRPRRRA